MVCGVRLACVCLGVDEHLVHVLACGYMVHGEGKAADTFPVSSFFFGCTVAKLNTSWLVG